MARSFDMGGVRNYARLSDAEKASVDFINWATEKGCRDEVDGSRARWAADAARHLRRTAPDRFTAAIASWQAGRAQDVYDGLVALAAQAVKA